MVRLRRLYRDANHCEPASNQHALAWAQRPELWAEHQIRFRGWSWAAADSTVRNCRILVNRIAAAAHRKGVDPADLVAGFHFPAAPELEVEA